MWAIAYLLFCAFICNIFIINSQDIIVKTKYGKLRGTRRPKMDSVGGNIDFVDSFLGIPYAKPPVADLRFRAPVPPCTWDGVRNATSLPSVCPQPAYNPSISIEDFNAANEDCLYLNIYAPYQRLASNITSYPVMVYIHGGSYVVGSGNHYTGFVLAHQEVVVVSFNYRLDFLGFFTSTDISATGNYGFQDQIEALTWIQENIKAFRGDPNKVTIFGNSAGGSSVGLHLVSAASEGLFHGAILQSGCALSPFGHQEAKKRNALADFAKAAFAAFGCRKPSVWSSVQCLKKLSPGHILKVSPQTNNINALVSGNIPWIDGAVLPDSPEQILLKGKYNKVPVMIGTVKDEGTTNAASILYQSGANDSQVSDGLEYGSLVKGIKQTTKNYGYLDVIANATVDMYATTHNKSNVWENFENFVQFATDTIMVVPAVKMANILAKQGTPVFQYMFNHKFKTDSPQPILPYYGVYHQIELNYIFGAPFINKRVAFVGTQTYSEQDRAVSRRMMTYWSNFAKSGTPCDGNLSDCSWKPFKVNTADYFLISSNSSKMKTNLNKKTVQYWIERVPKLTKRWLEEEEKRKNAPKPLAPKIIAASVVGSILFCCLVACNIWYCHKHSLTKIGVQGDQSTHL